MRRIDPPLQRSPHPTLPPIRSKFRGLGLAFALLALGPAAAGARTVRAGVGGDYPTLQAAINGPTYGAGDTIVVLPGTHTINSMLQPRGSGVAGSPIVVRGLGSPRPIVSGAALSNHKALWDIEQNNAWWVFENLVVRDMRGAQTNARGFFLVGCSDIVIQNCEVTNCWNGFMTGTGATRVTIQFCDIHDNGGLEGPAHNIYLSSGSDHVVQHNWIHDAHYGLCFKDRTRNLKLLYNWIENADSGGYEISLAGQGSLDRGEALVLGNVVIKSPTSAQKTHFVRFEDGRVGSLVLVNNTLMAQSSNIVVYSMATRTELRNNIFLGGKTLFSRDTSSRVLVGSNNWASSSLPIPAELSSTITGTSPGFVAAAGGDLRPADGSPCLDAGLNASPLPVWQYAATASRQARTLAGAGIDIGAFEAGLGVPPVEDPEPPTEDSDPPVADTEPPAAPASLSATAASSSRIDLLWSAPPDDDVASYAIQRATSAAGPFTNLATTTKTSYANTGLLAASTHFYRVSAVDGAGNTSEPSEVATATTASAPDPRTVTLTVTVGSVVFGDAEALGEQDELELVVSSAGSGTKHQTDLRTSLAFESAPSTFEVPFAASAPAKTKLTFYIWRWSRSRWQSLGSRTLGAEPVSGQFVFAEDAARYVSKTGEVRLRVLASAKTSFTFALDQLAVVPGQAPNANADAATKPAGGGIDIPAFRIEIATATHRGLVRFAVRGSARPDVLLFDVRGRRITRLAPSTIEGSWQRYVWNGRDDSGRPAARGLYFARVELVDGVAVRRFVWLRE